MPPERTRGLVSRKSDQYSLALTYFHLRTGALPFDPQATAQEVVRLHAEGGLDLSALPPEERGVIARATSLTPAHRFTSCTELVQALEKAAL
jgi:serine/threonine-protein kinase